MLITRCICREQRRPGLALEELHAQATNGASARASELTDQARVAALDMLGETEQAVAVAGRRLRSASHIQAISEDLSHLPW